MGKSMADLTEADLKAADRIDAVDPKVPEFRVTVAGQIADLTFGNEPVPVRNPTLEVEIDSTDEEQLKKLKEMVEATR